MKCKVCGFEAGADRSRCPMCGARLESTVTTEMNWNTKDFPKPREMTDIKMSWPDLNRRSSHTVSISEDEINFALEKKAPVTVMADDATEGYVSKPTAGDVSAYAEARAEEAAKEAYEAAMSAAEEEVPEVKAQPAAGTVTAQSAEVPQFKMPSFDLPKIDMAEFDRPLVGKTAAPAEAPAPAAKAPAAEMPSADVQAATAPAPAEAPVTVEAAAKDATPIAPADELSELFAALNVETKAEPEAPKATEAPRHTIKIQTVDVAPETPAPQSVPQYWYTQKFTATGVMQTGPAWPMAPGSTNPGYPSTATIESVTLSDPVPIMSQIAAAAATAGLAKPEPAPAGTPTFTLEELLEEHNVAPKNSSDLTHHYYRPSANGSKNQFYTFEKNNAEFQKLLDQEYDRLHVIRGDDDTTIIPPIQAAFEPEETVKAKDLSTFEKMLSGADEAPAPAIFKEPEAKAEAPAEKSAPAEAPAEKPVEKPAPAEVFAPKTPETPAPEKTAAEKFFTQDPTGEPAEDPIFDGLKPADSSEFSLAAIENTIKELEAQEIIEESNRSERRKRLAAMAAAREAYFRSLDEMNGIDPKRQAAAERIAAADKAEAERKAKEAEEKARLEAELEEAMKAEDIDECTPVDIWDDPEEPTREIEVKDILKAIAAGAIVSTAAEKARSAALSSTGSSAELVVDPSKTTVFKKSFTQDAEELAKRYETPAETEKPADAASILDVMRKTAEEMSADADRLAKEAEAKAEAEVAPETEAETPSEPEQPAEAPAQPEVPETPAAEEPAPAELSYPGKEISDCLKDEEAVAELAGKYALPEDAEDTTEPAAEKTEEEIAAEQRMVEFCKALGDSDEKTLEKGAAAAGDIAWKYGNGLGEVFSPAVPAAEVAEDSPEDVLNNAFGKPEDTDEPTQELKPEDIAAIGAGKDDEPESNGSETETEDEEDEDKPRHIILKIIAILLILCLIFEGAVYGLRTFAPDLEITGSVVQIEEAALQAISSFIYKIVDWVKSVIG